MKVANRPTAAAAGIARTAHARHDSIGFDSRAIERATRLRSAAGAASRGAAALMAAFHSRLHAHLAAARVALAQVPFELGAVGLGELPVEIGVDEARDPGAAECLLAAHDFSPVVFLPGNSITSAAFTMPCRTA